MNFTSFFIKHPVTATILNVMILVVGLLSLKTISVREYPEIKLPSFVVWAHYPNASAELVESALTNVLEDQLAGVEGVETMTSHSTQGACNIDLIFVEGTSVERALIAVRDAIALARSELPKDIPEPVVQQRTKSNGPPFMAISVSSKTLNIGDLTHYVNLNLKNAFRSLKGVAAVEVWGQPYTMTVSLDPQKLYSFGINADDVFTAIEKNNLSWPVGKFRNDVPTTMDLSLSSVADFEDLFIKDNNGKPIFLRSIADVQLKTNTKTMLTKINGKPGLILGISRTNDSNPLNVSELVSEQVEHLKQTLRSDMVLEVVLDQADFIRASLSNIQNSIIEAILLVLVIVFLFLRNIRATLIPLIAVPISLVGSVILLKIFGFSINTITLLAMVLAIGLVVDDAIVVLENIERHLANGMKPLKAALEGSREIGFAIVAMTLTLASVYAPIAFIQGAVGQLFVEFAVALAGSVLISGMVALTLSPLMCGKILRHEKKRLFPKIDDFFGATEKFYVRSLNQSLAHPRVVLSIAGGTVVCLIFLFWHLPSEIAPKEDRGLMGVYLPRIPGKDVNALAPYVAQIEEQVKDIPEGKGYLAFMGEWGGNVILSLKPHEERRVSTEAVVERIRPQMVDLPSIDAHTWSWESGLPGLDDAVTGGELTLAISSIGSYRDLFDQVEKAKKAIEDKKIFQYVNHNLMLNTPGYSVLLDPNTVSRLGFTPFQISKMIEVFFSGQQSLHFQKDGIRYQITLEGKPAPWTLDELYLTNAKGKRISLGTLGELKSSVMPKELIHFNQMRSVSLSAGLMPDQKIKAAMPQFWKLASESLSPELKKEWTGAGKLYTKSSLAMVLLFGMALIFIYAILAIQFENFLDPFIIMLTVPLGCFGALVTAWVFGQSLNIYTQIGLVTLIGLITKHGILIVEFANQLIAAGKSVEEAIREAARLRLRPILMTTGAMVFGALPLILSSGAGIEARRAIGLVLVGGLTFGTCFTLLILPKLYHLLKTMRLKVKSV
jgi:multidrug efflux pump